MSRLLSEVGNREQRITGTADHRNREQWTRIDPNTIRKILLQQV
ncbi:hypothetical protein [Moorena sp. SIO3H5]|nr:hypothetical protein [Moorena sp. SIO3H5]